MKVSFIGISRQFNTLKEELHDVFARVGSSGNYIMGDDLSNFENEMAVYCGTQYALGVGNGSDALFLSLKSLGIGPGDEVITCPNSFIATAWAVIHTGATLIFADSAEDLNICPEEVEKHITPRTKAVIPIHLTGRPANIDKLNDICAGPQINIIEDAAQAIGASYQEKKVGNLGVAASFSLHPLKNLGVMGDGGIVTTNDKTIYKYIKSARNHGLQNRNECHFWGYNSRLDSLQAAIASVKLKRLDDWNHKCQQIAEFYRSELKELCNVPIDQSHETSVYHNFVIQTPYQQDFINHMLENGVETKIHYPIPIHLQKSAQHLGYQRGDFPQTESQAKRIVSLPIYPELRDDEIEYVVNTSKAFFQQRRNKSGSRNQSNEGLSAY